MSFQRRRLQAESVTKLTEQLPIQDFLDSLESQGGRIFAKRLAANDTLATHSHQAGPYVPKSVAFDIFPSLQDSSDENPRVELDAEVISHGLEPRAINIIWYNQKTRDECHITRWGGAGSPVLDPDATGSLCLYAFNDRLKNDSDYCGVWLCQNLEEEDEFEKRFGVVDPGVPLYIKIGSGSIEFQEPTIDYTPIGETLSLWGDIKNEGRFPTGQEIVTKVAEANPALADLPVDERLLRRREAEFAEFRRLESEVVLSTIRDGFGDVEKFVKYANSVTNRRKARSGRSLELQIKLILSEEGLHGFAHDEVAEGGKRPDFIFPSMQAYKNSEYPDNGLRMLACKTTCKDRWRQVTDEADRIGEKHLLTLQEGVSENQFNQMKKAGVKLVVPKGLHKKFPKSVRSELMSIEDFIAEVRRLAD